MTKAIGFVGLLIAYCLLSGPAAAGPDKAELRRKLSQLWDGINTLEFQCDKMDLDEKGNPRSDRGFSRYEHFIHANGSRAVRVTAVRPGGEELLIDMRQDGKKTYSVEWDPNEKDRAERINARTKSIRTPRTRGQRARR